MDLPWSLCLSDAAWCSGVPELRLQAWGARRPEQARPGSRLVYNDYDIVLLRFCLHISASVVTTVLKRLIYIAPLDVAR